MKEFILGEAALSLVYDEINLGRLMKSTLIGERGEVRFILPASTKENVLKKFDAKVAKINAEFLQSQRRLNILPCVIAELAKVEEPVAEQQTKTRKK